MKIFTHGKSVPWLFLILSLGALAGCSNQEMNSNDYLLLMGESSSWKLDEYEIEMTPESFLVGNGTIHMKNENEYLTDFFHFETHAVISGEDTVIHSGSVSGSEIDITEETTGANEGAAHLNENGNPVRLDDISKIYMAIEWWNTDERKNVSEEIDLYSRSDGK
ncbi:hypothetical protein [Salibacterium lacus]|uniref:Uncharacterized protein n=1 Tax=Salibacterium lacus TaxID=1898109 RepID=A0ABW5T3K4_9BACI